MAASVAAGYPATLRLRLVAGYEFLHDLLAGDVDADERHHDAADSSFAAVPDAVVVPVEVDRAADAAVAGQLAEVER
ncbi:MAG: hypothetical protein L0Y71_22090, partial [Gemmataceae bacterium]|nr:hypothetical protein [Gemmataceae bacterium]